MTPPRHPILILGMHRSGTSYLASLVRALGVDLGAELVGPQRGNPRGHFEDRAILSFHERLLQSRLEGQPRAFDPGMMIARPIEGTFSPAEEAEARALLEARAGRTGPWGWKEPRTALFLPAWERLCPDFRGIVIFRHPWAVHDSARRRGHWDLLLYPTQVLESYAVYNRALLRAIAAAPERFLVVDADAALADPFALAGRVARFLGLPAPAEDSAPVFHRGEFRTLPRSRAADRALRLVAPDAWESYRELCAGAGAAAAETGAGPEAATSLLDALEPLLAAWPSGARADLVPALEVVLGFQTAAERDASRQKLAHEMGEKIRQTEAWNDEAARVFADNERLHGELKKLGAAFTEQQAFLAAQKEHFAKVWDELQKVGESWRAQKAYIDRLEKRGEGPDEA